MAVFNVFVPPSEHDGAAGVSRRAASDRVAFVRDGFTWSAAIFGPLWMIRHGLWLVLLCFVSVAGVIVGALVVAGAATDIRIVAVLALAILVGLEAATLRRYTLVRRGWRDAGIVVGDGRDAAERRFFERQIVEREILKGRILKGQILERQILEGKASGPGEIAPPPAPAYHGAASGPEIIGLFPGASR